MDNPQTFFGWVSLIFHEYGPSFIQGAGVAVYLALVGTILGSMIGFFTGVARTMPAENAAAAIGMSHLMVMRLVVIPQVFRNSIPQIGNYLISNIKDTSMLSVITVNELFYASRSAAGTYFRYFEVFFITCALYLFLTTVTGWLLGLLERRLAGSKNYELT